MEHHSQFLAFSPPVYQAIDLPATHQPQSEIPQDSDSCFYQIQSMSVSDKLFQNKLRKMEIEERQQQQKDELLQRRRQKQKQIHDFQLQREAQAQQQRQTHLRSQRYESLQKAKVEKEKMQQKANQLQARQAMIDLCRKRVEDKKQEYIFRIQSKTREKQERAHKKRKMIDSVTEKANDEVHFEEWKHYEANILKKLGGQSVRPDRLYQQFKEKNQKIKNLFDAKSKENRQTSTSQAYKKPKHLQTQSTKRITTASFNLRSNKKIEYYGVHEEDMVKRTAKDIEKMRKFIEQNTLTVNPIEDTELVQKFQKYFLQQILK